MAGRSRIRTGLLWSGVALSLLCNAFLFYSIATFTNPRVLLVRLRHRFG
ncbi:MAG: hypothetical protein GF330_13165, partial [Candidatus Eisenbacteria bacterium]|nr:hypothetical protein [Candidatus Eisenbacteria bacterium]